MKLGKTAGILGAGALTLAVVFATVETEVEDKTPESDNDLIQIQNPDGTFKFAPKCADYLTKKRDMKYDLDFWNNVVTKSPYTLIGDTNHKNPHLLSVLTQKNIIEGWAENGVTDIYLEARPDLQKKAESYKKYN